MRPPTLRRLSGAMSVAYLTLCNQPPLRWCSLRWPTATRTISCEANKRPAHVHTNGPRRITIDTHRQVAHHRQPYGTRTSRQTNAPGSSPVELRRVRVLARPISRSRDQAGPTVLRRTRQPRRTLVTQHFLAELASAPCAARATSCARSSLGLEPRWCRGLQNR